MQRYRGVNYSLVLATPPDGWRWQFQIGEVVKTGRTVTRLPQMAIRRVEQRIDRALRAAESRARVENGPRYGATLRVGQRVVRKDGNELGVVAEVDRDGVVKVQWDLGRTSYYRPGAPANMELAEQASPGGSRQDDATM